MCVCVCVCVCVVIFDSCDCLSSSVVGSQLISPASSREGEGSVRDVVLHCEADIAKLVYSRSG